MTQPVQIPPKPLISVVMLTMPSRAAFRSLALNCLFSQVGAPAIELVIAMDDGDHLSLDDAKRLVDSGIPRNVIYGTWKTVADKQNAAIAQATGAWITFWDDDDWSGPTRLADTAAAIARPSQPGIVGPASVLYHELIGKARRTLRFTTGFYVVDGCCAFQRALWERNPFLVKSQYGDVGDWIVHRVRGGTSVETVDFDYVAMVHGKNATMPGRPFRIGADGTVYDGPKDYQLLGGPEIIEPLTGKVQLAAFAAAAAAAS